MVSSRYHCLAHKNRPDQPARGSHAFLEYNIKARELLSTPIIRRRLHCCQTQQLGYQSRYDQPTPLINDLAYNHVG
jgi:hypothetical protein